MLMLGGTVGYLSSVGIGVAPVASTGLVVSTVVAQNVGIQIGGTIQALSGTAAGLSGSPTVQAGTAGDTLYGLVINPTWNAAGKATVNALAIRIIGGSATGCANAYGLYVDAPTGSSGVNYGIYVSSGTPAIYVAAGGLTVAGGNISYGSGELTGVGGTAAMTTGFIWLPAANAVPTGTPSAGFTGRAPCYYDSNNKKFWIWDGAWRGVLLTP